MCGNTLFWRDFREIFSPVFQYLKPICLFFKRCLRWLKGFVYSSNFKLWLLLILIVITCLSDFWLFQRWQWSTPLAQENEWAWPVTPGGWTTEKPNQSMYYISGSWSHSTDEWSFVHLEENGDGQKWCIKLNVFTMSKLMLWIFRKGKHM